ncbi:MAG TPA: Nif3-like dinuclear metal center hexameric protein [Deferrimonas sp.]
MKKERIVRIQELIGLVHSLYPPALAEEWDNVGLQVGDPAAAVSRVMVALDPGEAALAEARRSNAQALLTHHPLLFRPLHTLVPTDETGRVLFSAVKNDIAILCAHTNLDRGRDGLNDWLAGRLGLVDAAVLAPGVADLLKLTVFVPAGYEEAVAEALFRGGAGRIGRYDRCAFRTVGTGTFRPGAGANPFIGAVGSSEEVREVRLETVLPRDRLTRVLERMVKAHPYEEVAYDVVPLANRRSDVGLGRIGRLAETTTLGAFALRVKEALGATAVRISGETAGKVSKVAVCGGSGASLLGEALRQGADVLVTGDVKYHEARAAESQGIALIDAGHFATEHLMVPELARTLRQGAKERGLKIEFIELEGEKDPFTAI